MPNDYFGLFDTRPGRQESLFAVAIVCLLFAAFFLILPASNTPLPEVVTFVPVINSVMLVAELIIAFLFFAQASVFRSRALTFLAASYVYGALMLIPHTLTFPGAFAPDGLLGAGLNSTAWLATFRRLAFPIAIILYVLLRRAEIATPIAADRPTGNALAYTIAAVALARLATMLATRWHDVLPTLFANRLDAVFPNLAILILLNIGLTLAGMALLLRQRQSVLDLWLLVALAGWLVQSLINLPLYSRFSLGWYSLFVVMLFSSLIVMLALIAESQRLYARLVLSIAAQNREREARRLSIDAVAAAISHEVGQPLAAVTLHASAGLSWLARTPPDVDKAVETLRAVNDSGRRSFDVLKSIRAMFAKEPGWASEFSINDLVRETGTLLDLELAGAKVSLELDLAEPGPLVLGSEVQVQQVLINLIANAIDSVAATRGRRRRIAVRTASIEGGKVLLEVSDNGVGIPTEDTWLVFEAFNAANPNGAGIGLSLCRTIVEEHGGRIWASHGEKNGATFHVQLPGPRQQAQSGAIRPEPVDA